MKWLQLLLSGLPIPSRKVALNAIATRVNGALRPWGLKVVRVHSLVALDLTSSTRDPVLGFYIAEARPFLIEVSLEKCLHLHTAAFSCTVASGNPFLATLVNYMDGKCSAYKDSPLREFYELWQPRSAADALGLDPRLANHELVNSPPLACAFPWSPLSPAEHAGLWSRVIASDYVSNGFALDASHGWKVWGPISDAAGEAEFLRLVRTYASIKEKGYVRSDGFDGDIAGFVLYNGCEFRVMLTTGQHRVAALAALGYRSVPVRIGERDTSIVRRSEVECWPNVRNGLFTTEQALEVFDRIFDARQPYRSTAENDQKFFPSPVAAQCFSDGRR